MNFRLNWSYKSKLLNTSLRRIYGQLELSSGNQQTLRVFNQSNNLNEPL